VISVDRQVGSSKIENGPISSTENPVGLAEYAETSAGGFSDRPSWGLCVPEGQFVTSSHIRRALAVGLTYRPLPLTAADTLAWFLTLPSERQAKLRAGVIPEREAELLAKLRA